MHNALDTSAGNIIFFDRDFLLELVAAIGVDNARVIYDQAPNKIREISATAVRNARDNADYDEVLCQTHDLKGMAGNLGYRALHDLSDSIVRQIRQENYVAAKRYIACLPALLDRSLAAASKVAAGI